MHAAVANLMLEVGALVVVAALFSRLVELVDSPTDPPRQAPRRVDD